MEGKPLLKTQAQRAPSPILGATDQTSPARHAEQKPGRFKHMTAVESFPEPDEEISRWRTDFDEQVTYLDAVRNAKSSDKVVRLDRRPVAVDGYHQHFAGKLVVKRRHAIVERQHAATEGRTDLRITASEIRVDRRHDSALEYREYRRGIRGNWSRNRDSRGGGGAGD